MSRVSLVCCSRLSKGTMCSTGFSLTSLGAQSSGRRFQKEYKMPEEYRLHFYIRWVGKSATATETSE